jgi:hypothetical protein
MRVIDVEEGLTGRGVKYTKKVGNCNSGRIKGTKNIWTGFNGPLIPVDRQTI